MSNFRWLLAVLIAVAAIPVGVDAQQTGTITGQVVDAVTGRPLGSVLVQVTGSEARAATDAEGRYTIRGVPAGTRTATASVIGRAGQTRPVTVAAGQTVTVDFRLAESATELEGIVVNAITGRAERKVESGANVTSINVSEIPQGPITKMADLLTGRTAGVNLQGVAGTTGTSQRIRIRGANSLSLSNEPLIYVDGVLFSNSKGGFGVGGQDFSRLNDLNTEDIENVEVLKGPAASALYGTAAANGVLLITTKRGRVGAAKWRAYAEGGALQERTAYPDNFVTLQRNTTDPNAPIYFTEGVNTGRINTPAYVTCNNIDAGTIVAATGQPLCRQDLTLSFNPLRAPGLTPFQDGNRRKFGVSASGGGEGVTYFLSADKEDEEGVISYNTLDKTNLRANLNANLRQNLRVQLNSGYIRSNVALNANDNNIFSPLINGLLGLPVQLPEGADAPFLPRQRPSYGFGFNVSDIGEIVTNQNVDRFLLGANTTYSPATWLSTNLNVGLDYFSRHDFQTVQPGRLPIAASFTNGFRGSQRAANYSYTGNGSAVGTFDLRSNLVSTTTLGGAFTRELFESTYCFGSGIVEGTRSCAAASSLFEISEGFSEVKTIGGFLQQQFALNDRLFLAGSVRGDNNSAFGTDFGFIFYPSASLSWVVTDEPFFPELGFLSNLRLRTAIGTSGLRPNFRDAVTLLDPVAVRTDNNEVSAVRLRSIGNPDLRPERTREYEFGFDLGLFNDRIGADFTYFNKQSRDALISAPLAPSFGLTGELFATGSIFTNLGSIRNQGTELGVNTRVFDRDRARLNLRLSATTLSNRIEELGAGIQPIILGAQRHQEGSPAGSFYQRPFKFNDANGDGKLSLSEVTFDTDKFTVRQRTNLRGERITDTIPEIFLGNALPTNTQSITADLTLFKYVTLNTLFERRAGMRQFNLTESFRCGTGFSRGGRTATRPTAQGGCEAVFNPDASLEEQARFIASRFLGTNAGYIEDAEFIKWREASLTLGVPPALSRGFRALEGASLTLSGRNLRTWTDYSGLDPEINFSGGGNNFGQAEFNTQPPIRYFTARVDFAF